MTLRADYDVWHRRIHDAAPEHDDAHSPWYLLVSEYIGSVTGLSVLEVACGRGGFTRQLASQGARVTACDFSAAALAATLHKLTTLGPNVSATLAQGDAQNLPFADDSFDAVVSCETIEHLPKVQDALCELHRVARPGGKLFLTTPNYANFMGLYDLYARVRHPARKDDQPFDRRQWFPQVHGWLRWKALERARPLRKLLSPFAYTYFVLAEKH